MILTTTDNVQDKIVTEQVISYGFERSCTSLARF